MKYKKIPIKDYNFFIRLVKNSAAIISSTDKETEKLAEKSRQYLQRKENEK